MQQQITSSDLLEFENLFRETVGDDPASDTRDILTEFVEYMIGLDYQDEFLPLFADYRKLPVSIFKKAHCFMYYEQTHIPPKFRSSALGHEKLAGRFVYPVFAPDKRVAGLVGYDNEFLPKYLDSETYGYRAKSTLFYGEENIGDYYRSDQPVLFVEGPVCALALRDAGFQALAFLGSYVPPYLLQRVRRFRNRAVIMFDSDDAGTKAFNTTMRYLPEARVLRVTSAKDIDDSRKVNPNFFVNLRAMLANPFIRLPL